MIRRFLLGTWAFMCRLFGSDSYAKRSADYYASALGRWQCFLEENDIMAMKLELACMDALEGGSHA